MKLYVITRYLSRMVMDYDTGGGNFSGCIAKSVVDNFYFIACQQTISHIASPLYQPLEF